MYKHKVIIYFVNTHRVYNKNNLQVGQYKFSEVNDYYEISQDTQ